MKRKKRTSRSTFRAELIVQQQRDEASGLYVSDRFFQPACELRPHHLRWIAFNALLLFCLTGGLLRLIVTGFEITVPTWFMAAVGGLCIGAAALFKSEWCAKHWAVPGITLLLAYMAALFVMQDQTILGFQQLVSHGVTRLNTQYTSSLVSPYAVGKGDWIWLFLLFAAAAVVAWLGLAVLRKGMLLMMELLVLPAVIALMLFGAAEDTIGRLLLLFGVMLAIAFARTKRQKRMWGGENRPLVRTNTIRYENIQKKSALAVLIACLLLSAPGFLLVQPLLAVTLSPARELSVGVQTEVLNRVMKLLPDLTAGQWNLNVEAVSGGVQDGSIMWQEGYLLEGVEDLRLTLSDKPTETVFLKGYIGTQYENGSWLPAHAYTFDGAAINWNTEGEPRLFIQNLPFLRTAYALNQRSADNPDIAAEMLRFDMRPTQILVERINANPGYTYVPYGAYLNDYYTVEAGDGAVEGQKDQEDQYFFFFREDMEQLFAVWNELEDTANVLDRVEESYRTFCSAAYTAVALDIPELKAEIDAVKTAERWNPTRDTDEITSWIRRYLAEQYHYQLVAEQPPEGEDPLLFFINTSRSGNSVHFASAAVLMYRMFGVPARYAIGYEASPSLFTVQAGGFYTATLQGDQAQAWAEIYVPGLGWTPRDMTPGVIGTLEEVGPNGIRVENTAEENEAEPEETPVPDILSGDDVVIGGEQTNVMEEPKPAITLADAVRMAGLGGAALLVILLIIRCCMQLCTALGFSPFGRRSYEQRLLGVFQAVFRRLRRLKLPADVDSQSAAFVIFLKQSLEDRRSKAAEEAEDAVNDLYRSVYGGIPTSHSDVQRMRRVLRGLYRRRGKTKQ